MGGLFRTGVFLNSFLLFLLQPYVGKLLLPYFGGTASVWATVLVFFQGSLLAGYSACFFISRGGKSETILLAGFLSIALGATLFSLSIDPASVSLEALNENPVPMLLRVLALHFFIPAAVLSSGSTLYQRAAALSGERFKGDPYSLYSISNIGSFAALLCYPLILEPSFSLELQGRLLHAGYCLNAVLLARCIWGARHDEIPGGARGERRVFRTCWLLIPACSSALLIAVSTFISTNIAPVPLLWVIPLFLFLLSYAIGFSGFAHSIIPNVPALLRVSSLALLFTWLAKVGDPLWIAAGAYLILFFIMCVALHTALYDSKPGPEELPFFYLCVAGGGFLGGCAVNFVAPAAFDDLYELPLIICASIAAVAGGFSPGRRKALFFPLAAGACAFIALRPENSAFPAWSGWLLFLGAAYLTDSRLSALGPRLIAVVLAAIYFISHESRTLFQGRNFYGTLKVFDTTEGFRTLMHGVTIHGHQKIETRDRCVPSSYYYHTGPGGAALEAAARLLPEARIGFIGVGTGALTCYLGPFQSGALFELNPLVMKIAEDERYFTFIPQMKERIASLQLGDARNALRLVHDGVFDILVLDAFNSDAIPVHLLTAEAFKEYFRVLSGKGILLVHISNKYLDLQPVVRGAGKSAGAESYFGDDFSSTAEERSAGKDASLWAILGRDETVLAGFIHNTGWRKGSARQIVWTDQYSSIYGLLSFR